jgi:Family of unknown function (DUF5522)
MSSDQKKKMNDGTPLEQKSAVKKAAPLEKGIDYYLEGGLMVFTTHFLTKRGYCCESGCRHCPYGFTSEEKKKRNGEKVIEKSVAESESE